MPHPHSPQPKRCRRSETTIVPSNPLPGCANLTDNRRQFTGYFTGLSVEVCVPEHQRQLYENGCFGCGSRSKAAPAAVRRNQQQQQPPQRTTTATSSDDGADETLVLFPEEAFFLHYTLGCLDIRDVVTGGAQPSLQSAEILGRFCALKPAFPVCFAAYSYLRQKCWIVKAGIKFGGDFLLYKQGPRFYHASFVVLVRTAGDELAHETALRAHHMQGHYRIAEASKKDLLIVEIAYPSGVNEHTSPADVLAELHGFTAAELMPKRYNWNQERAKTETTC